MNKWRLLLFSVFGLLQITTSDRNFIDGRYSCCDHPQRSSKADTRIISFDPYRVYQDVPDPQQRKLLNSPLSVREQDIKPPTNFRQRELFSQDRSNERHAYERRLSRERTYDFNHSGRDGTRQERLPRNRDELTFQFVDGSRYSHKFHDGDRVNHENKNMREYVNNNHLHDRRNLEKELRNNERFVRERENSEESEINTRRNFYSYSMPDNNRLQPTSRNADTFRREDQRLFRRNTQVRSRSVTDENLLLVREYTRIKENQVDRRVISKQNLDSSRQSTSEVLREEKNENRQHSSRLDSERLSDVRRQVVTQLNAMKAIVGHIKYSREFNEIHDRDFRTISRGIRKVRTPETRGSGQINEQSDRREREVNTIRTKQNDREISEIREERNGPREYRAQNNFDYRRNRDSYQNTIRDMQTIRGLTGVRSEKMVLRERHDHDNDRDRSRNLLLLVRYRYSGSDDSRNDRNRINEDNRHDHLNTRREALTRPQTNIRQNNIIRVNNNREDRFNLRRIDVKRQDSMNNNRNVRDNRELTDTRQERETLHRDHRVNRHNIMRHERYSSSLTHVHKDKLDQYFTNVIREENMIREDNNRQGRLNIRQLVMDVSRINIRNEERRDLDDARRERRAISEKNRQYTLNARQSSGSALRKVNSLRRLDFHRHMNAVLENTQEKRDFSRQERRHSNNDRKSKITSRNTREVNFRRRIQEMSVRDNILNIFRNNRDNLLESTRITQRMHKRQNIRQVDEPEIRIANTLNNDDRTYDRIRQNDRDDSRTISRGIRYVRTIEIRESEQIIEQNDRRERDVNTIRTKQNYREISEVRDERNEPREYRGQDNFDYRQNRDNDRNFIQNMQRIRGLTDVRSEKMVLREKRDYKNDKDRSRDLLLLVRYRYKKSDDYRNNKNDLRIFSRNIGKAYDEEHINRNDERTYQRESQRVDNLRFRRNERDDLRLHRGRGAQTIEIYRTREDNEGLLRTVHERLSMRVHRDEPKMIVRSEESRENRENKVNRELFRTIRGERNNEDSDARRDTRGISTIRENRFKTSERNVRFVPTPYKPDTVTFEMKWQYLFYALQAMYLLSLLTKLPKHEEGKNKLSIVTWLTPTKSLKMD